MKTITMTRFDNMQRFHDETVREATIETIVADHIQLNDCKTLLQIMEDLGRITSVDDARCIVCHALTAQIWVLEFEYGGDRIMYKVEAADGSRMARCQIEALVLNHAVCDRRRGSRHLWSISYAGVPLYAPHSDGLVDLIEELQP